MTTSVLGTALASGLAPALALALLIDAENTSPQDAPRIMERIASHCGRAIVRRAYGDWTNDHLHGWKKHLAGMAIQPRQQSHHAKGKQSADAALIVEAMDLLHAPHIQGFCIVSSDSDFTGLAMRIREQGKAIYGFGRPQTLRAFVASCDEFFYLDALVG